jgi:hypothetical protein
MKSKVIAVATMVLLAATAAWAADVSGKWTAKVPGAQGQAESDVTFVFKVDGTNLTGTINNSQQPGDVEIKEGKISGDEVSFTLNRKIGDNELKVLWKGKVSGDEIKFTRTIGGGAGAPGAGAPAAGAPAAGAPAAGGPGGGGAAAEIVAKRAK